MRRIRTSWHGARSMALASFRFSLACLSHSFASGVMQGPPPSYTQLRACTSYVVREWLPRWFIQYKVSPSAKKNPLFRHLQTSCATSQRLTATREEGGKDNPRKGAGSADLICGRPPTSQATGVSPLRLRPGSRTPPNFPVAASMHQLALV